MSNFNNYAPRRVYPYSKNHHVEQHCRSLESFYFPDFVVKNCQPSPEDLYDTYPSDVYVAGSCNDLKKILKEKLYKDVLLTDDDIFTISHCIKQIGHHRNINSKTIEKSVKETVEKFAKLCEPVIKEPLVDTPSNNSFEICT